MALETNTKGQRQAMATNQKQNEYHQKSPDAVCLCMCVYMCVHVSEHYIISYLLFAHADTQFCTRLKVKNGIVMLNTVKFPHPRKQTKGIEIIPKLKRCVLHLKTCPQSRKADHQLNLA